MGPGLIPDKVEYKKLVHVDFVFGSCFGVMGSEGEREGYHKKGTQTKRAFDS